MSAAAICAVNCPAFTNVVGRGLPFHCTTELPTKLLPFTVSVKAAPPAGALLGVSVATAGTGLFAALIVKVAAGVDTPPPGAGLNTVTEAVPALAMSAAEICAVNCPPSTNVVVRFAPFHRTIEFPTKLLPFTVSVNPAPPAGALLGARVVTAGTGFGPCQLTW